MEERLSRTQMLLGKETMEKLKNSKVAIFGIGGVGGYICEALARCSIGEITIVDNDTVSESNINRQIIALHSTVGKTKTEAMAERLRDINPDIKINIKNIFVSAENIDEFDFSSYTYVADAIDTVTSKLLIIEKCNAIGTPIISCMGTGNKKDPSLFKICDITKTSVCPLARVMRTQLRKRGIKHLSVLFSPEEPIKPEITAPLPEGKRSIPGSLSFVPPVAGLMIAGEIIKNITGM